MAEVEVQVFRLHTVEGAGGGSGGRIRLIEGREAFAEALTEAAILAGIHAYPRHGDPRRPSWLALRVWRRAEHGEDEGWRTQKIVSAQELVDGQWVELEWELTPPRVDFARKVKAP